MINDPVQSSFPPSRVYKVIQKKYGAEKADAFLRKAREELFAFNKNISDLAVLTKLINDLGLNGETIVKEAEGPTGQRLLNEDFALAARLGVRGFPTIIMVNEENKGVKIVGSRSLNYYVSGLSQILNGEEPKANQLPPLSRLLEKEKLLFAKEIEVMYDMKPSALEDYVEKELPQGTYEEKELLGEKYFVAK